MNLRISYFGRELAGKGTFLSQDRQREQSTRRNQSRARTSTTPLCLEKMRKNKISYSIFSEGKKNVY